MFVECKSLIEENEILLYSCAKQDILPNDFKAYYEAYYFKFISDAMIEKKIYPTMQHSLSCLDFKELVSMKPAKPRRGIETTKPSVANFVKPTVEVDDNELDAEVIRYLNIKHAASDLALPVKEVVKLSSLQNVNKTTIDDIDVRSWYKSLDDTPSSANASIAPSDKASDTPAVNTLFEQFVKAYNVTPSAKATVTPSKFIPLHLRPPIVIRNKVKVGLVQRICKRIRLSASITPSANSSVAPSAKASVTPTAKTVFEQFAQAYNVTPSAKATVTPSTSVPLHLRPPIVIGNKVKVGLVQRICKRIQSVFTFKRRSN